MHPCIGNEVLRTESDVADTGAVQPGAPRNPINYQVYTEHAHLHRHPVRKGLARAGFNVVAHARHPQTKSSPPYLLEWALVGRPLSPASPFNLAPRRDVSRCGQHVNLETQAIGVLGPRVRDSLAVVIQYPAVCRRSAERSAQCCLCNSLPPTPASPPLVTLYRQPSSGQRRKASYRPTK